MSSVFKNSSTSGDKPEQMVVSVGMAVIVGVWLTMARILRHSLWGKRPPDPRWSLGHRANPWWRWLVRSTGDVARAVGRQAVVGVHVGQDQTAPSTSGKSTSANSSPGQRIWSGNGPTDGKPGNTVTVTSAGTLGHVVGCNASMV